MLINESLNKAKLAKNDEFYTRMEDVTNELQYYTALLKGKVVYCNCDDPDKSNFVKYLITNFHRIGLRKLIASYYCDPQYSIFSDKPPPNPIYIVYDGVEVYRYRLPGTGDFRSWECVKLLRESDVVITNPPFSMFIEFVDLILNHNKKFLVLGNVNTSTNGSVFDYVINRDIWYGINNTGHKFKIPTKDKDLYGPGKIKVSDEGYVFKEIMSTVWFTNMDHGKYPEWHKCEKEFSPENYYKYQGYDAINVDKSKDIPSDYFGKMGVPVSFIPKMNRDQFNILEMLPTSSYIKINGTNVFPYKRVIIQNIGGINGYNKETD